MQVRDSESAFAGNIVSKVVMILIAVVVVVMILSPLIESMSQTRIDVNEVNEGAVGYDLSYFTPDMENVPTYALTVTLDGGNVTVTGMGTKTADDMAIMVSDSQALIIQGGKMYYIDGNVTEEVETIELTLDQTELNDNIYEWVYFPEIDGIYASFPDGFQYNISGEVIGVGTFAGVSLISKDTVITNDNPYGLTAEIQTADDDTVGVIYSQAEDDNVEDYS